MLGWVITGEYAGSGGTPWITAVDEGDLIRKLEELFFADIAADRQTEYKVWYNGVEDRLVQSPPRPIKGRYDNWE